MSGFQVDCPFCGLRLRPVNGLLHLALAPRLAFHLWEAHPYETRILQLHLERPPDEWPLIEDYGVVRHTCAGPLAHPELIDAIEDCAACQGVPA